MRDSFFLKQRDWDGQFPQPTYFWHSRQIRDKARWGVKCFQTFAFTISGCWPNIDPCDLICWHVLISFPTCLTFTPRTSDPPSLATCEHQFYWPRFLFVNIRSKPTCLSSWISLTSTSQTQRTSAAVATLNSLKAAVNSFSTLSSDPSFLSDNYHYNY